MTPAPNMPMRSDQSSDPMLAPSFVRTKNVPMMDANMPIVAISMGRTNRLSSGVSRVSPNFIAPIVVSATAAMMEPV